ncbi:hypothetical protein [Pseudomonas amygdali]|uniref:hypothetical protein n=1 Tax=Pseudomonas amygdali TaxID=47877 RepID=UPI001FB5ADAC|nr:hypothetical protein [Pseudomonas amygdali]
MERPAEPAPRELVGDWTGAMGPYLVTLCITSTGTGIMCSSFNAKDTASNLKYRVGTQDGTHMKISSAGGGVQVTSPY